VNALGQLCIETAGLSLGRLLPANSASMIRLKLAKCPALIKNKTINPE
jgi:hypothetical protein